MSFGVSENVLLSTVRPNGKIATYKVGVNPYFGSIASHKNLVELSSKLGKKYRPGGGFTLSECFYPGIKLR